MKRAIIALSILCTGALAISPISNITFAQNNNNKEIVQNIENSKNENLTIENISKNESIDKNENKNESTDANKEIHINEVHTNKEEVVKPQEKEEAPVSENEEVVENKEEKEDKSTVEVIEVLDKEQAKELLNMINPGIDYIYQGDESSFEALAQRGLSGYVFLPNVDGDMGLFVDKNTTQVYYFHPSGYLELAI